MNSLELVDSLSEFKETKNIDRATLMKVLEDVIRTIIRKKYGSEDGFDIIVNTEKGDLEVYRNRTIVNDGELEDKNMQVNFSEAQAVDADLEVGDDLIEQINIVEFSRRHILTFRQALVSRISDLEREELTKEYEERVGEIVNAEVYQIWKKEILCMDEDGNELVLPKNEQIPTDFYKKGDSIKAVVKKIDIRGANPNIIISRTDPKFLEKLLEYEVPEIMDGIITIKKIVREPGERAKVAVESYDDRIDPVGACVGMKGSRIHGIVRELKNENIDIINYSTNAKLLIQRALAPAQLTSVELNEETKEAIVMLKPDQVSLAIGKGGLNIKLAGRLAGYQINVFRDTPQTDEEEYDIELDEFNDEIDQWILDELKKIGCDTGRSVLNLSKEELVRRSDLEEETIDELIRIINEEFSKS
jgi:N utilization substance protein A